MQWLVITVYRYSLAFWSYLLRFPDVGGAFTIRFLFFPLSKTLSTSILINHQLIKQIMKGVVRDTGLDNLIRVLSRQEPALSARKSRSWPRSYERRSRKTACENITATPAPPKNDRMLEKELVSRPSNDTVDGLERGVTEDVVGWYGAGDPEVLYNFPSIGAAD